MTFMIFNQNKYMKRHHEYGNYPEFHTEITKLEKYLVKVSPSGLGIRNVTSKKFLCPVCLWVQKVQKKYFV